MARQKVGEVFSLVNKKGRAYVQYLGRHPLYGDTVAVVPGLFTVDQMVSPELLTGSYVAFYPLREAVAQHLARLVGYVSPAFGVPARVRRRGFSTGPSDTPWVIEDVDRERLVHSLSPDLRRLPVGAIWNHEYALEMIESRWRPELESR